MIPSLAVILIGQVRTWSICAKYLQRHFKNRARQVDYFFVTWDTTNKNFENNDYTSELTTVTPEDILPYFNADSNLAAYRIVPDIPIKHRFFRMAFLSKIAEQLKDQYEIAHGFRYKQVVETRPDMYFRSTDAEWPICEAYQYSGGNIEHTDLGPFVPDCYFRMDSGYHKILSNRLTQFDLQYAFLKEETIKYKTGNHGYMASYLLDQNFNSIPQKDHEFEIVIRNPIMTDYDLDSLSYTDFLSMNSNRRLL